MTNISAYPFESSRRGWYYAGDLLIDEREDSWITKLRNLINRLFSDTNAQTYESLYQQSNAIDYPVESESISYTIERSLLEILEILHINIAHRGEVLDYIVRNSGLDLVVMYACILTENEFRHDSTITLDIFQDTESRDEYLTLYVRQEEYDRDIIARMDRICDEYEPALTGQSGWVLLTTDYKSPHQEP